MNGSLAENKLSFLLLEVQSCEIAHVTANAANRLFTCNRPCTERKCHVALNSVKNAQKSRTWQWASGHICSRSEECTWRVLGGPRMLQKITGFSFPLLLQSKMYFTNPSCVPHWERKTTPRSTALVNRIGLQPFLCTRSYLALVLCSSTAVGADLAVPPKARQYTRQALKRTESLIVPNTSPTQALGCADAAED